MAKFIWLTWMLVLGTVAMVLASAGATAVVACIGYAGENSPTFAHNGTHKSVIDYEAASALAYDCLSYPVYDYPPMPRIFQGEPEGNKRSVNLLNPGV